LGIFLAVNKLLFLNWIVILICKIFFCFFGIPFGNNKIFWEFLYILFDILPILLSKIHSQHIRYTSSLDEYKNGQSSWSTRRGVRAPQLESWKYEMVNYYVNRGVLLTTSRGERSYFKTQLKSSNRIPSRILMPKLSNFLTKYW